MSSLSLRVAACLGLLLVSVWIVTSDDSHLGGNCIGDVLLSQKGSTKSDSGTSYVVAYGGDPGVEISCITTQDLSPNKTVSTLVSGGPGSRYAVLRVEAVDDSDADFEVNIFGTGLSTERIKRETTESDNSTMTTTPKPRNKNQIIAAADDLGVIAKQLRKIADQLEAIQKILIFIADPWGTSTTEKST